MDTLTVVVKLTGLLLLTPSTPNGDNPTRVLFPEAPGHVAQIGYPERLAPGACTGMLKQGICYLDLHERELELGRPTGGSAGLPFDVVNLSAVLAKQVKRGHIQDHPSTNDLRARVTLNGGTVTEPCAMADWEYIRNVQNPQQKDFPQMFNTITWTMAKGAVDEVILVRKGQSSEERTVLTPPTGETTVELFIRHIPEAEAKTLMSNVDVSAWFNGASATADEKTWVSRAESMAPLASNCRQGTEAAHFVFFYNMLGAPRSVTLPRTITPTNRCRTCLYRLDFASKRLYLLDESPETLTCMVATGRGP